MPRLVLGSLKKSVGGHPSLAGSGDITYSGGTAVQKIPTFVSAGGRLNRGHLIYLPPSFAAGSDFKLVVLVDGQGSTPTTFSTQILDTWIAAMVALQIPDCVIVFVRKSDPRDLLDSWGRQCADGYDCEAIIQDVVDWCVAHAKCHSYVGQHVIGGFSEGGHIVLVLRAKYGAARFAAFGVFDSPRLDADLGGAAAGYSSFSTPEKKKIFNNDSAAFQATNPFSSIAGTGLFDTLGAGTGALLMSRSDPGGANVQTASMNNARTLLAAVPVTFTDLNVDDATHTPAHVASDHFDSFFDQATTNLSWFFSQMSLPAAATVTTTSRARHRTRYRGH